jgi:EAL and modified HD-GYP domain-containing signal transduction protein
VLTLGLDTLTGGRRAFINVTRHMLLNDLATVLSPDSVVIEVLENVGFDDQVVAAVKGLKDRGYSIALDDFSFDTGAAVLLPYARYVKVDVLASSAEERRRIEQAIKPGTKLLAEKVETAASFEEARGLGYQLFQGYYFCRPTTFSGGALSARRLAYARLLAALNKTNVSVNSIEDLIKHDASLTYRVLRCINSAAFGIRREIQSIRQALVLLGLDQVRKWASVWALAGLNGGASSELVTIAILRARSCELVAAKAKNADDASEYFLLGLCSLLEAMLGQPMATAVAELPLSDNIRKALLGEANDARKILDAVIAHERGEWDEAAGLATELSVPREVLPNAYADSLKWARELSQTAAAA